VCSPLNPLNKMKEKSNDMDNHQIKLGDKGWKKKWNTELNLAANPLIDGTQNKWLWRYIEWVYLWLRAFRGGRVYGRSVTLLEIRWTRLLKTRDNSLPLTDIFPTPPCGYSRASPFPSISLFSNSICIS
jgi:hypothetical protein